MADLPYKEEFIGEHQYRAVALPMLQWDRLSEFLAAFLGDPISSLVKGFDVGDLKELLLGDSGAVAQLFSSVAKKLTVENLRAVSVHMGPSLKYMGEDGTWVELTDQLQNGHWAMYRGELPGAVYLFLRAQYADFFSGFGALLPVKKQSKPSPSENTSDQDDESPST